jgi:cysteine desulfurase
MDRFYFDHAATTPVDPDVLKEMLPFFSEEFGNPSSIHFWGQKTEAVLEDARLLSAKSLHVKPENVIFTACGTESDNLALRGLAFNRRKSTGADEIIISPVEHHAVSLTAKQLAEEFGFKLIMLPVDSYGMVNPEDLTKRISSKTALVSVIYGNNEIGTINPVEEIGTICGEAGVPFHSDAVQAAAHLPMDMKRDNLDLISIGAHKMYGPKGVGLLGIKSPSALLPVQTGGGQEYNLRAGTQNIPLIVGLARAFALAQTNIESRNAELSCLRDELVARVLEEIPGAMLTGHPARRLPNHASFVFDGVDGNRLLTLLDVRGFACSSGSACKVGSPKPSEVLLAMGIKPEIALGSLRVTLGRGNTVEQVAALVTAIAESVEKIRK